MEHDLAEAAPQVQRARPQDVQNGRRVQQPDLRAEPAKFKPKYERPRSPPEAVPVSQLLRQILQVDRK